jgi:hypothetical protein
MRYLSVIGTFFALLEAFAVAPFQHVHPGSDHDHGATIHAHFYRLAPARDNGVRVQLQGANDDDDHDAVWSIDSFTLVPPAVIALFVPPRTLVDLLRPPVPAAWVDMVEECGHDPPDAPDLIPRAPPS